jgi:hypothetical protein
VPDSTSSPVKDVEHIEKYNRGKAVSDRESSPRGHQPIQRCLHLPLTGRVKCRGHHFENENPRIVQQCPRDRDSLLLTSGEPVAAPAYDRVVARVELHNPIVSLRIASRLNRVCVARVWIPKQQVLTDR